MINRLKKIREITHFTIATSNIKYLGETLTKQVKDLYDKNFNSLKKEIRDDFRRWNDLPCSWIGKINTVKNGYHIKSNLQIQCNTHKNLSTILHRPWKNNTKFHIEKRSTQDS